MEPECCWPLGPLVWWRNAPIFKPLSLQVPPHHFTLDFLGLLQAQNLLDGPGTVPPCPQCPALTLPFPRLQYLLAMVLVLLPACQQLSEYTHSNLFLAL